MLQEWRHVHLGAGGLGLGLVVHLTHHAGLSLVVANRKHDRSLRKIEALRAAGRYRVAVDDESQFQTPHAVTLQEVLVWNEGDSSELEDDKAALVAAVNDESTILLTTALTFEGLRASAQLIRDLLDSRMATGAKNPLYFMTCENRVPPEIASLFDEDFGDRIIPLHCVVDRICREPEVGKDSELVVHVEPYAGWIVQFAGKRSVLLEEAFAPLVEFGVVHFARDHPISEYQTRKRWLVNGVHLASAILGRTTGEDFVDVYLQSPEARAILEEIQDELLIAVQNDTGFSANNLEEFNAATLERFGKYRDRVERILRRFRKSDLEGFIADLHVKLGEPASRVFQSSGASASSPWTSFVIREALRLIHEGEHYLPN